MNSVSVKGLLPLRSNGNVNTVLLILLLILTTFRDLGEVYSTLNYEKSLKYYERALKGQEKTLGKSHPNTLETVMGIAIVYENGLKDFGKAEDLYQRALKGHEAQLGKDHKFTKRCAVNLATCLVQAIRGKECRPVFRRGATGGLEMVVYMVGEKLELRKIIDKYPHIMIDQPAFKKYL